MPSSYPEFRRKLDAVLRQRDPQALRAFLVAEGQWDASTATNPERAMWMMIATSPALAALHDEATRWLAAHGYAEEARALGRKQGGGPGGQRGGGSPRGAPQAPRRDARPSDGRPAAPPHHPPHHPPHGPHGQRGGPPQRGKPPRGPRHDA